MPSRATWIKSFSFKTKTKLTHCGVPKVSRKTSFLRWEFRHLLIGWLSIQLLDEQRYFCSFLSYSCTFPHLAKYCTRRDTKVFSLTSKWPVGVEILGNWRAVRKNVGLMPAQGSRCINNYCNNQFVHTLWKMLCGSQQLLQFPTKKKIMKLIHRSRDRLCVTEYLQ